MQGDSTDPLTIEMGFQDEQTRGRGGGGGNLETGVAGPGQGEGDGDKEEEKEVDLLQVPVVLHAAVVGAQQQQQQPQSKRGRGAGQGRRDRVPLKKFSSVANLISGRDGLEDDLGRSDGSQCGSSGDEEEGGGGGGEGRKSKEGGPASRCFVKTFSCVAWSLTGAFSPWLLALSTVLAVCSAAVWGAAEEMQRKEEEEGAWVWLALPLALQVSLLCGAAVEKILLFMTRMSGDTCLWKVHFYCRALRGTLRWGVCGVLWLIFSKGNWLLNAEGWLKGELLIPLSSTGIVATILYITRSWLLLATVLSSNRKTFATAINELFFLEAAINRLRDPTAYSPDRTPPDLTIPEAPEDGVEFKRLLSYVKKNKAGGKLYAPLRFLTSLGKNGTRQRGDAGKGGSRKGGTHVQAGARVRAPNQLYRDLFVGRDPERRAAEMAEEIFTRTFRKGFIRDRQPGGGGGGGKGSLAGAFLTPADFECVFPDVRGARDRREAHLSRGALAGEQGGHGERGHGKTRVRLQHDSSLAEQIFDLLMQGTGERMNRKRLALAILDYNNKCNQLKISLRDNTSLASVAHSLSLIVYVMAVIGSAVLLFQLDLSGIVVPSLSMLPSLSFVFGNTGKVMLESAIFIFVTKPFRVGDRVNIGDNIKYDRQDCYVKSIQLLHTTFTTTRNKRLIVPNHVLASTTVYNISRSSNAVLELPLLVAHNTPPHLLWKLTSALKAHCVRSPDWKGSPRIHVAGLEGRSLKLGCWVTSTHNWDDPRVWVCRTNLVEFLRLQLLKLSIKGPPGPDSHSTVTLRAATANTNATAAVAELAGLTSGSSSHSSATKPPLSPDWVGEGRDAGEDGGGEEEEFGDLLLKTSVLQRLLEKRKRPLSKGPKQL